MLALTTAAMRELIRDAPRPIARANDPTGRRLADEVVEWLRDAGMRESSQHIDAIDAPVSVVVLAVDADGAASVWAVPDRVIPPEVRAALDAPWHRAFAIEEIQSPGPLYLLSCCGAGDAHSYAWLGEALGVAPDALRSAHGAWSAYLVDDLARLRGATVTHLYAAHVAT